MDFNKDLLKLVFPEVLLEHFDLTDTGSEKEILHFYFLEKNIHPKEFRDVELVSKGFYEEITVQDFPLRGKRVYLHIKRRPAESFNAKIKAFRSQFRGVRNKEYFLYRLTQIYA